MVGIKRFLPMGYKLIRNKRGLKDYYPKVSCIGRFHRVLRKGFITARDARPYAEKVIARYERRFGS